MPHKGVSEVVMKTIGNILWVIFGGGILALLWAIVGLWCITIVGIPFGLQFIKFAQLAIMPFGAKIVRG